MCTGNVERLEASIKEIMEEKGSDLNKCKSCVGVLREGVLQMAKTVEEEGFATRTGEVAYFKQEAPKIYGRLFFYMKLVQIEGWRQYYCGERFLEELRGALREAEAYLEKHATMCEYHYQERTYWDEHLFTRRSGGDWPAEEVGTFIGNDFTLGSYWVSWILANEWLREWVTAELEKGQRPEGGRLITKLKWTGQKVELVELFYSLHLKGCFNGGKITLKGAMEWAEDNFEIELGNFHTTIDEMSIRKKGRTRFLHELAAAVEMKMDEKL